MACLNLRGGFQSAAKRFTERYMPNTSGSRLWEPLFFSCGKACGRVVSNVFRLQVVRRLAGSAPA